MSSVMRAIEQERAGYAWNCVESCLDRAIKGLKERIKHEQDVQEQNKLQERLKNLQSDKGAEEWKKKYGALARKIPSLILTNGLGQTMAFLRAKGKKDPTDEHEVLYQQLNEWLQKRLKIGDSDLLEWIVNSANSQQYRLATMEALSFLQWLKRFAEAELPKGGEEG